MQYIGLTMDKIKMDVKFHQLNSYWLTQEQRLTTTKHYKDQPMRSLDFQSLSFMGCEIHFNLSINLREPQEEMEKGFLMTFCAANYLCQLFRNKRRIM